MLTPRVQPTSVAPNAHASATWVAWAPCGHHAHLGTCGHCQRRKLALLAAQNAAADEAARAWQRKHSTQASSRR
jgi:hypothetical protein